MTAALHAGYVINAWADGAVRPYRSVWESRDNCAPEVVNIGASHFGADSISHEFAGMFAQWQFECRRATNRKRRSGQGRDKALRRLDAAGRVLAVRLRREIGPGPKVLYCDQFHDPRGGPAVWQVSDLAELRPYWHRPSAGYVIDLEFCGEWAWEYWPASQRMIGSTAGEGRHWFGEVPLPLDLIAAFSDWHSVWSEGNNHEAFDWDAFNAQGLALARNLKEVIGARYTVIYLRPFEEPRSDDRARAFEVRFDGLRAYAHQPYWMGPEPVQG
jgi:hypothetical protein